MKRKVVITQEVTVTVNVKKFTAKFMKEFRESFYNFYDVPDHIEHLGQLYARGIVTESTDFIEGYGDPKSFGIKFNHVSFDTEVY